MSRVRTLIDMRLPSLLAVGGLVFLLAGLFRIEDITALKIAPQEDLFGASLFVGVALLVVALALFLLTDSILARTGGQLKGRAEPIRVKVPRKLRDESVRLSISALVRIEVTGRFLLVYGSLIPKYHPVGGVLKYYESSRALLAQLGMQDDHAIERTTPLENDLRVRVPARNLGAFFDWYASGCGRESSPWREFHEELIDRGILPAAEFPYIDYQWIGRHVSGLQFSKHFQCWEVLVAEIYHLLPTPGQSRELKRLRGREDERYRWATEEEIHRLGVQPGGDLEADIAENSEWLLIDRCDTRSRT